MGELECKDRLIHQQVPDMGETTSQYLPIVLAQLWYDTKRARGPERENLGLGHLTGVAAQSSMSS